MRYFISLVCFLSLMGCDGMLAGMKERQRSHAAYPIYVQDSRTNLCFAHYTMGSGAGYAHVPCSDEVMKMIKGKP